MRRVKALLAAAALGAAALGAPTPADARVTVTVEFAYGTVVAGGVGIFIYFAGSWEAYLAENGLPTALLELRDGRLRPGLPLPAFDLDLPGAPDSGEDGRVRLDLLRWRF